MLSTFNYRLTLAAFTWYFWEIACHRDDNINNNHISNLYWWTKGDNIDDAKRNKKLAKGSKFTEEEVLDIYKSEETNMWLARKYNCHAATIRSIKLGKSYWYITGNKNQNSFAMHFNNEEYKQLEELIRPWFNWYDLKEFLLTIKK